MVTALKPPDKGLARQAWNCWRPSRPLVLGGMAQGFLLASPEIAGPVQTRHVQGWIRGGPQFSFGWTLPLQGANPAMVPSSHLAKTP